MGECLVPGLPRLHSLMSLTRPTRSFAWRDTNPDWTRLILWNMSAVRIFQLTAVTTLLLSSFLFTILAQDVCAVDSQPNLIASIYPDTPTGTLNATLAIVPIPLDTARRIVPPQYAILECAYRTLLPDFPAGMYPVLMQAGLDHDIQLLAYGISVPDFQVSSVVQSRFQRLSPPHH